MRFSASLRFQLLSLTVFHTDETASLSPSCCPPLTPRESSISSSVRSHSDSEEQYYSFRSTEEEEEGETETAVVEGTCSLPNGTLRTQQAFFAAVERNEGGVLDLMMAGRRCSSAPEWLAQLDSKMAAITSARDHLR